MVKKPALFHRFVPKLIDGAFAAGAMVFVETVTFRLACTALAAECFGCHH
jgi:hypothetical protein